MACVTAFQAPLLLFVYLCLVFFLIVPFLLLLMEQLLLPFLSIVVFLRVLSCLLLYSYFSLMIFSAVHLTLYIHMPMTQLSILLFISNLLLPLHLEFLLIYIFPIPFLQIWIEFPGGVASTL